MTVIDCPNIAGAKEPVAPVLNTPLLLHSKKLSENIDHYGGYKTIQCVLKAILDASNKSNSVFKKKLKQVLEAENCKLSITYSHNSIIRLGQ